MALISAVLCFVVVAVLIWTLLKVIFTDYGCVYCSNCMYYDRNNVDINRHPCCGHKSNRRYLVDPLMEVWEPISTVGRLNADNKCKRYVRKSQGCEIVE